ncbi:MAG TPA: right-handed parallel beta-helix repeat-containing protein, partial [Candidatus Anammoximicrobium sp.]|nr:right-handed parallel beta-helix repeat-containing protein [Candidatus Anammoximicrobium sp.]
LNNIVTSSGSGIHTDNNGDGGGVADLIQGNQVSDGPTGSYGIYVFAAYLDVVVQQNTVTNVDVGLCASGQFGGVPSFVANTVDGEGRTGSTGIYTTTSLFGWGDADMAATFTNNFIKNVTDGVYAEETGGMTASVTLFNNSFTGIGNLAVDNDGASTVDASGNWWGSATEADIAADLDGPVDYTPWLNSGTEDPVTGGAPGFQGDFSYLHVSAASPQTGTTGSIQEAIDLLANASLTDGARTVDVKAGTYVEQVTITKSLQLIGAGEASTSIVAPAVRTGSVTQGTAVHDYIVAAYAPTGTIDVRIEGFTIDADEQNKTAGTARLDGLFLRDVKDAGGTAAGLFSSTIHGFDTAVEYESWGVVVYGDSSLTLDDNAVSDFTRDGIDVFGDGDVGADPTVTISNNVVTGNGVGLNGIAIEDGAMATITGNTVTGNTRPAEWAAVGILVWGSDGVIIGGSDPGDGNQVGGNFYGIDLAGADNVTVRGNTLTDNIKRAISLDDANNNTVAANVITGPAAGTDDVAIGLANGSTGNIIGGATAADGNTITLATAGTGNVYAVHVQGNVGAGSNTIQHNNIQGGKRAVQIDGGVTGTTTIDDNTIGGTTAPSFAGIVAAGGSVVITDNALTNAPRPIKLEDADGTGPAAPPTDVSILRNTITGSDYTAIEIACQISGTTKEIKNNIISGVSATNYGDGIDIYNPLNWDVSGQNTGFTISGNDISGGTAYFAAMWMDIADSTISGNIIHDNSQGIMLQDGTGNTIEYNVITNTGGAGAGAIGGGIILYGTDRFNVHPGTVYGSKDNTIQFNTITGGDIGIAVTDLSDANSIDDNDINDNGIGVQVKTLNPGRAPTSVPISNNDLTGNTVGIQVSGGGTVDAGGGGTSAGGNDLSGYTGALGNYAIENLNTVADSQPDVYAMYNDWGPLVDPSIIENYVFDDTDDADYTRVIYDAPETEDAVTPVYVNDDWAGLPLGSDPDGAGPASQIGVDAFARITDGVNAVAHYTPTDPLIDPRIVYVYEGSYFESNITVTAPMTIDGGVTWDETTWTNGISRLAVLAPAAVDDNLASLWGGTYQQGFIVQSSDVTIQDLTIDGEANPALTPGRNNFRVGIATDNRIVQAFDNFVVDNVTVQHTYFYGISNRNDGVGMSITDSRVEDVGYGAYPS